MMYSSLPASVAPNLVFSASQSSFLSVMCKYTSHRRSARTLRMHPLRAELAFLELFLIFIRYSSLRLAISDPEFFQSSKPERCLNLPPLEVHTGEFIRHQRIG